MNNLLDTYHSHVVTRSQHFFLLFKVFQQIKFHCSPFSVQIVQSENASIKNKVQKLVFSLNLYATEIRGLKCQSYSLTIAKVSCVMLPEDETMESAMFTDRNHDEVIISFTSRFIVTSAALPYKSTTAYTA